MNEHGTIGVRICRSGAGWAAWALMAFAWAVSSSGASGAESGAEAASLGLGRAPLPAPEYARDTGAGRSGLTLELGWADLTWELDGEKGSKKVFSPQASLFHLVTERLDVHLSVMLASGSDRQNDGGKYRAETTRVGAGLGYRMKSEGLSRVTPFAGVGLGYWLMDASTSREGGDRARVSVDDWFGLNVHAGVALLIADGTTLRLGVAHDRLLGKADATVDGPLADFSMSISRVTMGVGLTF